MDRVTYQDLVTRFGSPMAFDLLLTIEKLAKIKTEVQQIDEDSCGARDYRDYR